MQQGHKKLTAEESTIYRNAIRGILELQPGIEPRTKNALEFYYNQIANNDPEYQKYLQAHLTAGSIQIKDGNIKVTGGSPYIKAITDANGLHLPANNITAFLLNPPNGHPLGKMPQLVVALLKNPIERENWKTIGNKTHPKIKTLIDQIDAINASNASPLEKEQKISKIFDYKSYEQKGASFPVLENNKGSPTNNTDPDIEETLTTMLKSVINTVNLVDDREDNCKQLNTKKFPKVHAIHYINNDMAVIDKLNENPDALIALDFDNTVFNGHSGGWKKQKIDGKCNSFVKTLVDLSNKGTIQFDNILMASNNSVNYTSDADSNLYTALHTTFKTGKNEELLRERLGLFNRIRHHIGTEIDGKIFTFYDAVARVTPAPQPGPSIPKKNPASTAPSLGVGPAMTHAAEKLRERLPQKMVSPPHLPTKAPLKKGPKNA